MKKISFCFFVCLILFLSPLLCSARSEIIRDININVKEDLTFDIDLIEHENTDYWIQEEWSIAFGKDIKNVQISNELGPLAIKKTEENNGWINYYFDTGYKTKQGYKKIYIKSSGNQLKRINDALYLVDFSESTWKVNLVDFKENLKLSLPESLEFLSIENYTKLDMPKNNLSFNYKDGSGIFTILLIKKDLLNTFVEIPDDNKIFLVENKEDLKKYLKYSLANKNLILNYPVDKKDFITISTADTLSLDPSNIDAWGIFYPNNLILMDNSLYYSGSSEENEVVLLHELTHYANKECSLLGICPTWFSEGLAVSTEIKYIDKYFPTAGGSIPTNLNLYARKPTFQTLEKWYSLKKNFIQQENSFDSAELYSLYGFPINYYVKNYGESPIQSILKELKVKKAEKEKIQGTVSEAEMSEITENLLIAFSGASFSKEELYFPKKELIDSNKETFKTEMKTFILQPISAEELLELRKQSSKASNTNKSSTTWIIILVVASILVILFVVIYIKKAKRFKKKKSQNK